MFNIFNFKRKTIVPQSVNIEFHYGPEGYYIKNEREMNEIKPKITVVTPVYNAEKYLRKTIDSVVNQTIGMENLEYILVDDGSTDTSREILLEYAEKYQNLICVFLQKNTGTPAQPRNLGIKLSSGKYITFLDADDWLEHDGLQALYEILEESGDDYVVGKTLQIKSNGLKIVGEHESCKERRNISPYTIPHIFQHLGPRARMMRTEIIKENNITFPEMKYAEDKQFFIDVLIHCQTISTTCKHIYNLNRMDDNNASLTKQTNIMQKTDSNLKVIHYVINKNLDVEKEKLILNRLYEFDSITRLFNTNHFKKTKLKDLYFVKFNEILKTTEGLRYEFSDNFHHPINKVAYQLIKDGNKHKIAELFDWDKKEKVKDFIIKDNLPYMVVPFLEGEHRHIRMPMLALYEKDYFEDGYYHLQFKVYGDYVNDIEDVILRDREKITIEYTFPVNVDANGSGLLRIKMEELNQLPTSNYVMYLRYGEYNKINIRKLNENQITYADRSFSFYTTINSNIGFKIK